MKIWTTLLIVLGFALLGCDEQTQPKDTKPPPKAVEPAKQPEERGVKIDVNIERKPDVPKVDVEIKGPEKKEAVDAPAKEKDQPEKEKTATQDNDKKPASEKKPELTRPCQRPRQAIKSVWKPTYTLVANKGERS